jgi:hypothetical protein
VYDSGLSWPLIDAAEEVTREGRR